ncbi:MAG: GNAT family N-acetyltransferase [Xanthobacteraceae bacterium]|nr:GNAT family N-acetyltransferase [Xanthobacteraceae bacterium]
MNNTQKKSTPVISVGKADEAKAIATVALAFASDPMMRWSFTDPAFYLETAPRFVRAFGGNAFEHGTADAVADFACVALWLPPEVEPNVGAMIGIFEKLGRTPEQEKDGEGIFAQMEHFHPKEPHWYLPLIGADPAHQGKGYGAALMAHAVKRCDESRLPAYLESSNPGNVPFYERFGFKAMGKIQQGSSPLLTPMLRQAR